MKTKVLSLNSLEAERKALVLGDDASDEKDIKGKSGVKILAQIIDEQK